MPKAIVVAVGDTPLNPLNDLLKQNSISSNVIDAATNSVDEIEKLIQTDDQGQCVLIKGVSTLSQHISGFAGAAEKLVLLYCSPATALGNALEISNGTVKPEQVINRWQESVSQAMELLEESELYSLCDLNDVLEHSSLFLKEFFALEKSVESKPSTYTKKQLANHLATLYLFEEDDAFALYDEALSIGKLFGEFTVHLGPETEELKSNAETVGKSVLEQLSANHQEIQAKGARLQQLQQQLNDTQSKESELHASVEKLKAEKSNVEESLGQTSKRHEEQVKELETQLEALKNTKLAFEKNIADLNGQLGQSKTLNTQQSEKLESLQKQLELTNTKLKEATENKEQVVAQYDEKIEQTRQYCANLENEKQKIVKQLEEHKQLLQAEKQAKQAIEQTLEEIKQASQKKDEQLKQQSGALAEQNTQITALEKKIAELQQAQQNYSNLENEKQEIAKQLEEHKQLLQAEKQAKEAIEQNLKEIKHASQNKDEQLNHQSTVLAEQNTQITTLKQQVADWQQNHEAVKAENRTLKESNEKQQAEINSLIEDNHRRNAEHEAATKQLKQANSENKQLSQDKIAIEEQYHNVSDKLKEANKRLAELESLPAKLTSLSQEYELAELQIAQLQEELESTVAQLNGVKALPEKLEEAQATIQQYEVRIEGLSSENTLAEMQVAQLQEELESTVDKMNRLKALPDKLEEAQSTIQQLEAKIEGLSSDNTLAEMQVAQLQEELEVTLIELTKQQTMAKQLTEQTKSSQSVVKENNQLQSDKNALESEIVRLQKESELLVKQNTELENKCKSLTQQVDAATQSQSKKSQALIGELQSQLAEQIIRNDQIMDLKNKLESQLKESEAGMTNNKEFHQAELELASLQISQLQEELEYYYLACQEAQNKGVTVTTMANQRQKVFSKAMAAGIKVIGKYADDGYQDIHFVLSNVRLGCGKEYAELPVKLANVGGHIAIEFRDSSEGTLFQHYDDTTDEYGPFLRFFANPSAEQAEQQNLAYNRMNASERVLVMSTIALLAELLQNQSIECEVQVDASEWRIWRLAAIKLLEASENLPAWLSFDSVAIREEFRTSGYEHLWLVFKNVLVGDNWQERLELKVAASNVTGDEQPFSSEIALEFRTLEDGTPPLLSWPPETTDEYGHKLIVQLGDLNSLTDLATPDLNLITHLVNNLSSIIEKAEEQEAVMQRPKNDWITAVEALSNQPQPATEAEEPLIPEASFSVNEVVSMGSYQHVLFSKPDDSTKVKLKAQNINPDTFDAELFVELRNGEPDVIYHDTQFYGEDEYGPRVQIPAEALFVEIATEGEAEFGWLLETYAKVRSELESSSEVDELVKRLWVNMLNRKQSIL
jgi:hypothetical protein